MDFLAWKEAVLSDIETIGFNQTYKKYKLSSSVLRHILTGDEYAGLQSWKRVGAHLQVAKPELNK